MDTATFKKLVSKSEFARVCGVSPAAVTNACHGSLRGALHGKRVDMAHPSAVAYMQNKAGDQTENGGIDPLYDQAVALCRKTDRFTASNIEKNLNVGYARSKRILALIKANGVENVRAAAPKQKPPPPVEPAPPPPVEPAPPPPRLTVPPPPVEPAPQPVRGAAAKKQQKKDESLRNLNNQIESGNQLHEIPDDIKAFADMSLRELILRFGTETAFKDWLSATKQIEDINEKRLKNATIRGELVNREIVRVGVIEPIDRALQLLLTDGSKTIARRVHAMAKAGRPVEDCVKYVSDTVGSFIRPVKAKTSRTMKTLEK